MGREHQHFAVGFRHYCKLPLQVALLFVPVLDFAVQVLARTKNVNYAKVVPFKDIYVSHVFEARQHKLGDATDLEVHLVDCFVLEVDPLLFLELLRLKQRAHPQNEGDALVPEEVDLGIPLLVDVQRKLSPKLVR